MDEISEMLTYLKVGARMDLKSVAVQYILGLTGSDNGKQVLRSRPALLRSVLNLMHDPTPVVAKDACLCIVNLTAEEEGARALLSDECCNIPEGEERNPKKQMNIVTVVVSLITDPESNVADPACAILSNITRPSSTVERVIQLLSESDITIEKLVAVFTRVGFNKKGATLQYLGPVFSNLSQSSTIRKRLLDKELGIIQRLLPFTDHKESIIRRGGIVGTIRNCCFDTENHMWLLGPEVDILPRLLLPLAGPEDFTDDETNLLPPDLQYLPEDKTREPDPDLRHMLLESLLQLCSTKEAREFMRKCNTYLILREFHKWEQERKVLLVCEIVINILIRTEEEIGHENIKDIEVPDDMHDKFQKMDEDFIKS